MTAHLSIIPNVKAAYTALHKNRHDLLRVYGFLFALMAVAQITMIGVSLNSGPFFLQMLMMAINASLLAIIAVSLFRRLILNETPTLRHLNLRRDRTDGPTYYLSFGKREALLSALWISTYLLTFYATLNAAAIEQSAGMILYIVGVPDMPYEIWSSLIQILIFILKTLLTATFILLPPIIALSDTLAKGEGKRILFSIKGNIIRTAIITALIFLPSKILFFGVYSIKGFYIFPQNNPVGELGEYLISLIVFAVYLLCDLAYIFFTVNVYKACALKVSSNHIEAAPAKERA